MYNGPERGSCSDYFVPSYTPTLDFLICARNRAQPISKEKARILLAAVPRPHKWDPLPFVLQEVQVIKNVVPSSNIIPLPANVPIALSTTAFVNATAQDVIKNLPSASILHLACHGQQNFLNALTSGFVMADRTLTLAEVMTVNLPSPFLAFLNACETAKSDESRRDQIVHLAAAMLFLGFRNVVGTMWCVA